MCLPLQMMLQTLAELSSCSDHPGTEDKFWHCIYTAPLKNAPAASVTAIIINDNLVI